VKALAERRFDGERFPVVMIDGVDYAGETTVVAMGITEDGTKRILGLRQGATEKRSSFALSCWSPARRGLDTTQRRSWARWLQGAPCGSTSALGPERRDPAVPSPQKRNVKGSCSREALAGVDQRLAAAYQESDYEAAKSR